MTPITSMGIVLIISIVIVFFSGFFWIFFDKEDTKFIFGFICCIITFFGLFLLPIIVPNMTEYHKLENYKVIKTDEVVILDLSEIDKLPSKKLYKIDSYKVVTNPDSIEYFMKKTLSLYRITIHRNVCYKEKGTNQYIKIY